MDKAYLNPGPTKDEIDSSQGTIILEFGAEWCGHCKAAAPLANEVLQTFPAIQHIKVEDGKGRRLGRLFSVKLWPTFVLLKDGKEISRAVRPQTAKVLQDLITS